MQCSRALGILSDIKNRYFQTVVLEKTWEFLGLQSILKEINPVFIGRTEAEAPILWPPDAKSWLIGKDPDVGKDWRQEEKRMAENEMVGWHHWLNGHELKQDLGDGEGYRETWYAAVHGVTKSWAGLNDWKKNNRHKQTQVEIQSNQQES